MSLFINSLAYVDSSIFSYTDKIAILIGSFLSGNLWLFDFIRYKKKSNHST